jgi:hypothetical protein
MFKENLVLFSLHLLSHRLIRRALVTQNHKEGAAAPESGKSTDTQAITHASKHARVTFTKAPRQSGGQSPAGIPGQADQPAVPTPSDPVAPTQTLQTIVDAPRHPDTTPTVLVWCVACESVLLQLSVAAASCSRVCVKQRLLCQTSRVGAALIDRWAALHDAAPGLWSPELRALDAPLLAPVLLHAWREYGRHLADRRFADLLASVPPSFERLFYL